MQGTFLRIVAIWFPGYVHPDEYFQNQEVAAELVLGFKTVIPWEFSCELEGSMFRSIMSPFLISGIPFIILKFFGFENNPVLLFIAPRVVLMSIQVYCEHIVLKMFGDRAQFLYSTSWVSLVFFIRPFSNTLEAFYLLACMWWRTESVVLGVLIGFGCFNRITFPAFCLPVAIYGLLENDSFYRKAMSKKKPLRKLDDIRYIGVFNMSIVMYRGWNAIRFILMSLAGFFLASLVHITLDALYINSHPHECHSSHFQIAGYGFQLTPLNNLLYNSNSDNLSLHGLHPRYTHVVVNMQLLFGGLWMYALFQRHKHGTMLKSIILSGLLLLSIAPHQEARFMIPLLFPIIGLTPTLQWPDPVKFLWIGVNLILIVFFGIVHQGGIIPILWWLNHQTFSKTCIASVDTYMVPRFQLMDHFPVLLNLGGANLTMVASAISMHNDICEEWLLMLPTASPLIQTGILNASSRLMYYWPHFSGERMPKSLAELSIELHRYNSN